MRAPNVTGICRTCCRPVAAPFRRVTGKGYDAGCVDADHDGHLYGTSLEFHNRRAAKAARKAMKDLYASR